jgi:hypothetical protein
LDPARDSALLNLPLLPAAACDGDDAADAAM